MSRFIFGIIPVILVTACSSVGIVAPVDDNKAAVADKEGAAIALRNSNPCCNRYSELAFRPLAGNFNQFVPITTQAESFEFDSGKSYVIGYELPTNVPMASVTLSALMYETVFQPTILLLNENFQAVRIIESSEFQYEEASILDGDRLTATFVINQDFSKANKAERYMLVYTTDESMRGESEMTHPAKQHAKGRGNVEPDIANPMIPHAATGILSITVGKPGSWEDDLATGFGLFPSGDSEEPVGKNLQPAQSAERHVGSTNEATHSKSAGKVSLMLEETEAFYNQLIEQYVKQDKIEKALKLVEEAEYAGSHTARTTFIEAVKKK